MCKAIKKFLKKFDFSGYSFAFKYKSEERHTNCYSGCLLFVYIILSLVFVIINLIPFGKNKNFSLHYYTMNLQKTERLNLYDKSTSFAFGLDCREESITKQAEKLFDIKIEYKSRSNDLTQTKYNFTDYHLCKQEDFVNGVSDSFKSSKLEKYFCLNKDVVRQYTIEGIYTDESFEYYTITLAAKNNSESLLEKINRFLLSNDCKLQYYYTDVILDIDSFKEPIKYFMDSLFIQINPHLFSKKNIFYMNYYLYNYSRFIHDTKFISFFKSSEYPNEPKIQIGFSKQYDYYEYKGLNRTKDASIHDRTEYARIYIRADNKKIEIKRHYEDIMEFYANNSILIDVFNFLCIVLGFINEYRARKSLVNNLFFYEKKTEKNYIDKLKIKNILYNNNKIPNNYAETSEKKFDINNEKNDTQNNDNNTYIDLTIDKMDVNYKKNEKKTKKIYNLNCSNTLKNTFCFCCDRTFNYGNDIIETPDDVIDSKLDIVFYIKNMFILELINNLEFESKQNLINLLSTPIIKSKNNTDNIKVTKKSSEDTNEDDADDLYKLPNQLNFDKLDEEIKDSINNTTERNIKIIKLLKEKINE